jgi:hypothetical protein
VWLVRNDSQRLLSRLADRSHAVALSSDGHEVSESIYGSSIRHSAERAAEARKEADHLACVAWNQRMLGFKGPAQPSPALGDALNAGYLYLEVRCLGCDTHQTVALNVVRRPKATPIHELERYMRCKDCSEVRGYPYKRSHLVALRPTKISALDPPSTWWPGERRRCAGVDGLSSPRFDGALPRREPIRPQPTAHASYISRLSGTRGAQRWPRAGAHHDAVGNAAAAPSRGTLVAM